MGTSISSKGAPSGVPIVPPWVPDIPPIDAPDSSAVINPTEKSENPDRPNTIKSQEPVFIAPIGRFGPSRTQLSRYARSGSSSEMKRGIGHYINKGLGGARTATNRFNGTASVAGTFYGALSSATAGQVATPGSPFDPALLAGRTASEITDALVETVRPIDGTQDAEASRRAIRDALSELLNRFPDADLLSLTEIQRVFVIEHFVAIDVYTRFYLDVGKSIQDKAASASTALSRLKEVKDYIKQTISAACRKRQTAGRTLNARLITQMVREALQETFQVFEDFVR